MRKYGKEQERDLIDGVLVIDPSDCGESGLYLDGSCYSVKENNSFNMFRTTGGYIVKSIKVIIEVGRKIFKGCQCNFRIMDFIRALITFSREQKKKVQVINMDYNFYKYDKGLKLLSAEYNKGVNDSHEWNPNLEYKGVKLWQRLFNTDIKPFVNVDEKHAYGYYWVSVFFPNLLESLWEYKNYQWEINERACLLCFKHKKEYKSKDERCK